MRFVISKIIGLTGLCLGSFVYKAIAQSVISDRYLAAKYSRVIDFSRLQSLSPEIRSSINSSVYYIQYGDQLAIELKDPGDETGMLPVVITRWDYRSGKAFTEMIFDNVKKYYIVMDSIPFSIDDCRSTVNYICDSNTSLTQCDSAIVKSSVCDERYLVVRSDSLANFKFYNLFYPDLKFLPKFIQRQDIKRSPLVLDQVIFDKQAIDSLLNTYAHEGYERITEEEMNSFELQVPIETLQELDRIGRSQED